MNPRATATPAKCVVAGTLIHTTSGLIPAARVGRMRTPPDIAAYSHIRQQFEFHPLLALRENKVHQIREIKTEGGRSLWCTSGHLIYSPGRGYTPAVTLRPGAEVIAADDAPAPLETRPFRLPWLNRPREDTRPAIPPPAPEIPTPREEPAPLPLRHRDWVYTNRPVRGSTVWTVYDFQVQRCGNFVADGLLTHNCLLPAPPPPHKNRG